MLAIESDVVSPWLIDLWQAVPTPEKAVRVRESSIARILKDNRIRKTDAASVLVALRATPVQVAPGTTDAAVAHTLLTRF